MKKLIAILLCLVMVVSMVACGGEKNPPPTDEKVITIGVFEPTSGQNGAGGKKEILGIQYANSLYPTVTIGGEEYKIELTYADNQSDSSKAPTAAQQLVSKGVTAVLGTYGSSCAIAGGPYFEQAKIPAIGTSCTNPAANAFAEGFKAWLKEDSARLTDNSNSEEISAVTACGYDAYMAIYYALDKAQSTDGATLRDALAALDVPGLVTGDLKFDENGDAIKSYAIIKTATTEGFVFADSVAIE